MVSVPFTNSVKMASASSSSRPQLTLFIAPALQLTTLVLLFIVFMCPNPFGSSDVTLMVIRPVVLSGNQTMGAAATSAGPVFGGNSSLSVTQVTTSSPGTTNAETTMPPSTVTSNSSSIASSRPTPRAVENYNSSTTTADEVSSPSATPLILERLNVTSATNPTSNDTASTGLPGTVSYSSTSLSWLELKYGAMGGCLRSVGNKRTCTPASLSPSLTTPNGDLASSSHFDVRGLPDHFNKTFPILLLTSFITAFVLLLVSIPTLLARTLPTRYAAYLSPDSAVQRHLTTIQRYALYVRLCVVVLMLIAGIGLRMQMSKAVYAFNAANSTRLLSASSLRDDSPVTTVGLQAYTGSAFGLLWAAVVLLLIETWLERRRLRREEAILQARKDIEGQYGREIFEMVRGVATKGNSETRVPVDATPTPAASSSAPSHDEEKARLYSQLQEAVQREIQLSRQLDEERQAGLRLAQRSRRIPVPEWEAPPFSRSQPQPQPQHIHHHDTYDVKVTHPSELDRAPSYRTSAASHAHSYWLQNEKVELERRQRELDPAEYEHREWMASGLSRPHYGYAREYYHPEEFVGDSQSLSSHDATPPQPRSRSTTPLPDYVPPPGRVGYPTTRIAASHVHNNNIHLADSEWSDVESGTEERNASRPPRRGYRPGLVGGGSTSGGGLARLKYVKG